MSRSSRFSEVIISFFFFFFFFFFFSFFFFCFLHLRWFDGVPFQYSQVLVIFFSSNCVNAILIWQFCSVIFLFPLFYLDHVLSVSIFYEELLTPFEAVSSGCNALVVPFQQLLQGPIEVLLCEHVNDLRHSLFHLLNCLLGNNQKSQGANSGQ